MFIKLNYWVTNKYVYVKTDSINAIVFEEYRGHSEIYFENQSIFVKETPEQILEMIKEEKNV